MCSRVLLGVPDLLKIIFTLVRPLRRKSVATRVRPPSLAKSGGHACADSVPAVADFAEFIASPVWREQQLQTPC